MKKVTQVAESMQKVLGEVAQRAGKESGFVKRESKLTASAFVQTLVLGWMSNPEASLEQLTQTTAALGIEITPQALDQRFTQSAAECIKIVLEEAVKEAIGADPVAIPIIKRFNGIYIFDSSTISLPDELGSVWIGNGNQIGTNSSIKIEVGLDYSTGELSGPFIENGKARDFNLPIQQLALSKGALRLADQGYFSMEEFERLDGIKLYWLSRLQPQIGIKDDKGKHWQIAEFLQHQQKKAIDRVDMEISLGSKKNLKCRLLAIRVPQQVAQKRRARLYEKKKRDPRNGSTPSQQQLTFADWTVFVTNVEAEKMSLEEALILARVRWQIELLFKLWKSHGKIDESRSEKKWRILCEVYAKLIAMLIQHWILITSCWSFPNRSLFKAAQTVQRMALALASAFGQIRLICSVLATISRCLNRGCRINKRKSKPNTYQLLLDLDSLA